LRKLINGETTNKYLEERCTGASLAKELNLGQTAALKARHSAIARFRAIQKNREIPNTNKYRSASRRCCRKTNRG